MACQSFALLTLEIARGRIHRPQIRQDLKGGITSYRRAGVVPQLHCWTAGMGKLLGQMANSQCTDHFLDRSHATECHAKVAAVNCQMPVVWRHSQLAVPWCTHMHSISWSVSFPESSLLVSRGVTPFMDTPKSDVYLTLLPLITHPEVSRSTRQARHFGSGNVSG